MPQMMPLPWLLILLVIFFCYFSIYLLLSGVFFFSRVDLKNIKPSQLSLPW